MEDKKNYKTALSVFIQSIKTGTKFHEYELEVGITPQVLQNVGLPQLPMVIGVKMLDKCHFDHGITEATLARLDELIANPTAIYKSDSPHIDHSTMQAVVLVTIENKDGNPLLVAVHANQTSGRRQVNKIKSIYDKKEAVVKKWRANGLLLWDRPTTPAVQATVMPIKAAGAVPVVIIKKKRQITKS